MAMKSAERRKTNSSQLPNRGRATMIVSKIQGDSLKMVRITAEAILVKSPTHPYTIYHMQISNEYYKQNWSVCKRYSELYRLRKNLLNRLKTHPKGNCCQCNKLHNKLKNCKFPKRVCFFLSDIEIIHKRTTGLVKFLNELCNILALEDATKQFSCKEIVNLHIFVKDYLHFPLEHQENHILAIRSLDYLETKPNLLESEGVCPICLGDWMDRGEALVQSACGHFFHEVCISEWFKTRFDCPLCRSRADKSKKTLIQKKKS